MTDVKAKATASIPRLPSEKQQDKQTTNATAIVDNATHALSGGD